MLKNYFVVWLFALNRKQLIIKIINCLLNSQLRVFCFLLDLFSLRDVVE